MSYFAAAVVRVDGAWSAREVDLADVEDLEELTEAVRDLDSGGLALLLLEQDDEWLGVLRVEGDGDPRVFLSDRRAIEASDIAALLWEDDAAEEVDPEEEEGPRPVAEPVGDAGVLADLGTPAEMLLALCAEKGMLPADVLSAVGERAGFVEVLDELREV
ncbi:MAG TPA: tRNA adenosine deaminase-associated protein [Mycobacteriales bacterium]|nr:tRNA adenosine deaminase-associated protein [Mycobacteriales bacterium]